MMELSLSLILTYYALSRDKAHQQTRSSAAAGGYTSIYYPKTDHNLLVAPVVCGALFEGVKAAAETYGMFHRSIFINYSCRKA